MTRRQRIRRPTPAHLVGVNEPPRHGMTRNEVAAALGLTRQQVSDIERAALKKLARHPIIRELWGAR